MEISKSNDNTHRNKERDRVRGIHGKPWQEIKKFVNYGEKTYTLTSASVLRQKS